MKSRRWEGGEGGFKKGVGCHGHVGEDACESGGNAPYTKGMPSPLKV